ncbi:MAG: hypothetical protein MN733_40685 [Nitrososphaera sp.]|nr:hypothetical protein [Nitrososphaera sp.]
MAKNRSVNFGDIVTPVGVAAYAYLSNVHDYEGKASQKITIFLKPEDAKELMAKMSKAYQSHTGNKTVIAGTMPVKKPTKYDMEKVPGISQDMISVTAKTAAQYSPTGSVIPVPCVDSKRQPCDDAWTGDLVRVQAAMVGWEYGGRKGISLYLQGVQVVEKKFASKSGFSTDQLDVIEKAMTEEAPFDADDKALNDLFKE